MDAMRSVWVAGLLLLLFLALGCAEPAPYAPTGERVVGGGFVGASCARPAEGCPCDGDASVRFYADGPAGACDSGIMQCRGGRFSACEPVSGDVAFSTAPLLCRSGSV